MAIQQIVKVWDHEMEPNEQLVLIAMADHANEDGTGVWPSNELLSKKTGYSERTITRIKSKLKEKGFLVKVSEPKEGRGTEYEIRWPDHRKKGRQDVPRQHCPPGVDSHDDQNVNRNVSNSSNEQAELDRSGALPPKPKHEQAAVRDSPHQAIAHIDSFEDQNAKSHYLSSLFLSLFGHGHDKFGEKNLHGRICGIKNEAKSFTDEPYKWVIRELFRIKNDKDFGAPTDQAKQNHPFRIHHYLKSAVSGKREELNVEDPEPGDKVTEEEKDKLIDSGGYREDEFNRFTTNVSHNEPAFYYRP